MIKASFFGLLMAAIGLAVLKPTGVFATAIAAINLSPFTTRTDEKDHAATWRATKPLSEWSLISFIHK
jgi:hypothetical protein